MPKKLIYTILINNNFTKKRTTYSTSGNVSHVTNILNNHFGIDFFTNNTTYNIISRKNICSKKYENIHINRIEKTNKGIFLV
jgi:hypothetical protein